MNDLQLDTLTGDLLVEDLSVFIVKGADRVRQNLDVKLNLWSGEWFLDTEFGTPYLDGVLGKQISLNGATAALKKSILEVADVDRITRFSPRFDRVARRLNVDFECYTPFGLVRGPQPRTLSPVAAALESEGVTVAQFVNLDDRFNTLINLTIPSRNY